MQLEELTGKIDMVIEILKRIEGRLIRLPETQAGSSPPEGDFASRRAKL